MKLRNKIFLCVVMKILEISAIIYIPYFLGCLYKHIPIFKAETFNLFTSWMIGIFGTVIIATAFYGLGVLIYWIYRWFKWNWDFVNQR